MAVPIPENSSQQPDDPQNGAMEESIVGNLTGWSQISTFWNTRTVILDKIFDEQDWTAITTSRPGLGPVAFSIQALVIAPLVTAIPNWFLNHFARTPHVGEAQRTFDFSSSIAIPTVVLSVILSASLFALRTRRWRDHFPCKKAAWNAYLYFFSAWIFIPNSLAYIMIFLWSSLDLIGVTIAERTLYWILAALGLWGFWKIITTGAILQQALRIPEEGGDKFGKVFMSTAIGSGFVVAYSIRLMVLAYHLCVVDPGADPLYWWDILNPIPRF